MLTRRLLPAALLLALVPLLVACGDDGPAAPKQDGKTMAAWKQQLKSTLPKEQGAAITALAKFAQPPLEALAPFLERRGRTVRLAAIHAMGAIGPAAAGYAGKLAPLLEKDPDGVDPNTARVMRDAAMHALGKMGKEAFKPIAHLLVSEDPRHRLRAVFTIRPFVKDLEDGTNTLLPLLEDEDANVRREAVKSLGVAGVGDPRASAALLGILKDSDTRVVGAAAVALGGIGGRSDREGQALADLLFNHQSSIRSSAAYGLGLMGEEASPYIGRIEDLMRNDGKLDVRVQAARAHFRIRGDADAAMAPLREAVRGEHGPTCREAARALREMGPEAKAALPDLAEAAKRFAADAGMKQALDEAIADIRSDG